MAGIFTAGFVTASGAYIADKTSKEKRGKNMALLSSVAGLGAVAGPLLGNLFSKVSMQFNLPFGQFTLDKFSSPFVISSVLTLVVFVLYVFLLPESLNAQDKMTTQTVSKSKSTAPSKLEIIKQNIHAVAHIVLYQSACTIYV